jgi:hypothetical protein
VLKKILDWQLTVGLQDPSRLTSYNGKSGLRVKFFHDKESLPKVQRIGDIIIIRGLRNKLYAGSYVLLSNWATKSTVYPADKIPDPAFGAVAYAEDQPQMLELKTPLKLNIVTPEERLYVMQLRRWALQNLDPQFALVQNIAREINTAPLNAPTGPRLKLSLLKDVKDGKYYDLIGEVRKFWTEPRSGDVYITDYTSNSLFFDYQQNPTSNEYSEDGQDGDAYNYTESYNRPKTSWPGPFGKMALQVHLWPPHNAAVIEEGDYVFIKNALVRFRNGKYLEASLHQDNKNEDQIDVRKLSSTDERLGPLLQRRREYLAKEDERLVAAGKHVVGGTSKPKLSNAEKKKLKRVKRQQAVAEAAKKAKLEHGELRLTSALEFFEPKAYESTNKKADHGLNENGMAFPIHSNKISCTFGQARLIHHLSQMWSSRQGLAFSRLNNEHSPSQVQNSLWGEDPSLRQPENACSGSSGRLLPTRAKRLHSEPRPGFVQRLPLYGRRDVGTRF